MQRLCLEGTTERSDSNRGRSPRISAKRTICLEGSTPVAMLIVQVLWRSAFQAPRSRIDYPRTSSPVTIATLCSAFQAQTLHEYEPICTARPNHCLRPDAFMGICLHSEVRPLVIAPAVTG